MGVKKQKSQGSKSIGFPSGRRSPSLESTAASGSDTFALTPEGGVPIENLGHHLYDCCAFIIYCPKHKHIALSGGEKGKGFWLPFVTLKSTDTWLNAAIGGVSFVLSHGDIASFANMRQVPFTNPEAIHILRLQVPQDGRFVTRIIYLVRVTSQSSGEWRCCQGDKRVKWLSSEDVLNGNIERLWGPEPYMYADQSALDNKKIKDREIVEFSLDDAFVFVPHEPPRNKEEEMLKSAIFLDKDISRLYSDFIQHCYPSQFMSFQSFVDYMSKIGWSPTDVKLTPIFRAFNYRATGFLTFHELLLGLGAMDQATQHGGHPGELRCGYIFRYYDGNNDGYLDFNDIQRMTADIFRGKDIEADDATIDKEAKHRMSAMGLKKNEMLQFSTFLHAVGALTFRGTSVLFRSPIATLQQLANKKTYEDANYSGGNPGLARRRYRGTCQSCKAKKFKWALHGVRMDFTGKIGEARLLSETEGKDISFTPEDQLTEQLRAYSRESVFNANSHPNNVLETLRQFDAAFVRKRSSGKEKIRDWMTSDRNVLLNTITALCKQAEEIFAQETRCVKVSSPCYILGDIHGNLTDLMTYERLLWRTAPSYTHTSFLFLGDYVDRGEFGVECVSYLFAMKILAPDKFFLCRGNHEIRSIQKVFTFQKECITKYGTRIGPQIWEIINKVFDRMPICAIVDETIYGAHGGIPTSVMKVEDLMKIPTPLLEPEGESPPAWEIMWNDPMNPSEFNDLAEFMKIKTENIRGFLSNTKRGTAFYFTEEAVNNFLDANGLTHIVRGHEVMPAGYKFHVGGKVTTVFSSSNYCGGSNEAATIYCDGEKLRVVRLDTSVKNESQTG